LLGKGKSTRFTSRRDLLAGKEMSELAVGRKGSTEQLAGRALLGRSSSRAARLKLESSTGGTEKPTRSRQNGPVDSADDQDELQRRNSRPRENREQKPRTKNLSTKSPKTRTQHLDPL
jgi:hypothetical protein